MNAVGPVAVIAAGIFFGYLVLSGREPTVVALLTGNSPELNTPGQADTSNASYGSYAAPAKTSAAPTPLQSVFAASQNNLNTALQTGGSWGW